MLLRVLPKTPVDSSILFAINFPGLPPALAEPAAWVQQADALVADDLNVPTSLYAFDKAVALPAALLEQVTFDLTAVCVSCRFIDGSEEQWSLSLGCIEGLQIVLDYLTSSSALTKNAVTRAKESESSKVKHIKQLSLPTFPSFGKNTNRHRKQRSLMSWMSSFIQPVFTLNNSLLRSKPARTQVPPLTQLLQEQSQDPPLSARAYRSKARSTLLDLFRRHVIPELVIRVPRGGYYCWIVQSMLNSTATLLAALMERVGDQALHLPPLSQIGSDFPVDEGVPSSPTSSQGDLRLDDSAETDSDGSSVHTPSSAQYDQGVYFAEGPGSRESGSPPPGYSEVVAAKEFAQYTAYAAMALRLRDLLERAEAQNQQIEMETQHRYAILEVRSRRRAWLNRKLTGGVSLEKNLSLATPFVSSPLRRSVYTWEDVEYQDSSKEEESFPLLVETTLFPVCEEEDDDEILIDDFPGVPSHGIRPRRVGSAFGGHATPPRPSPTEVDTVSSQP